MALSDSFQDSSDEYSKAHTAFISHELIAGAASYEAAKAYEEYVKKNQGVRPSHEKAKEIFAAASSAFIDREVESKGLDFIDRERARWKAQEELEGQYNDGDY